MKRLVDGQTELYEQKLQVLFGLYEEKPHGFRDEELKPGRMFRYDICDKCLELIRKIIHNYDRAHDRRLKRKRFLCRACNEQFDTLKECEEHIIHSRAYF